MEGVWWYYGCAFSISFIYIILPSVFSLVSVGLDYCPYLPPPEIGLCVDYCDSPHHLSMALALALAAAPAYLDHSCYIRLLVATMIVFG